MTDLGITQIHGFQPVTYGTHVVTVEFNDYLYDGAGRATGAPSVDARVHVLCWKSADLFEVDGIDIRGDLVRDDDGSARVDWATYQPVYQWHKVDPDADFALYQAIRAYVARDLNSFGAIRRYVETERKAVR